MPHFFGINDEWINSSVGELYCFDIRWERKIKEGKEKKNIRIIANSTEGTPLL